MKRDLSIQTIITENKLHQKKLLSLEKIIPFVLLVMTSLSILTSLAIIVVLLKETLIFFTHVPISDFFTGTVLKPLSNNPQFGILPLISATIISSVIALSVAGPIGMMIAVYLSEYASENIRKVVKPLLEILAGIPTIVYGFFALTFLTPLLKHLLPSLETTNILSPGIMMGIMIIPMIASLSEDAMNAVPNYLREGAYGLGSTKYEVATKVVIPAALSGIIASFVLAISRAIGETMIVTIASGSTKNFSLNITESMQTMTAYIVEVTGGDAPAGSTIYYSLYAVAMTLFIFTFLMNICARYISQKFKEEYK